LFFYHPLFFYYVCVAPFIASFGLVIIIQNPNKLNEFLSPRIMIQQKNNIETCARWSFLFIFSFHYHVFIFCDTNYFCKIKFSWITCSKALPHNNVKDVWNNKHKSIRRHQSSHKGCRSLPWWSRPSIRPKYHLETLFRGPSFHILQRNRKTHHNQWL
jgi:hypothetical protein